MSIPSDRLYRIAAWLVIIAIVITALVVGSNLLIPVAMAAFLAMLLLPIKRKLLGWNFPKWLAVMCSELLILLFLGGLFAVVSVQVVKFTDDLPEIEKKAEKRYQQTKDFVVTHSPISQADIDSTMNQAPNKILSGIGGQLQNIFSATTQSMVNFSMTIVYTFLFLYYSTQIKEFMIQAGPKGANSDTEDAIYEIAKVAPSYLTGKLTLITFLAITYSIGLSIIGVKYAVLFGVLAAALSIIPYIGNMLGGILPAIITFINSESLWPIAAIFLVFAIAQFLESNILEPIIVGSNVDINPMTSIIGVVTIGSMWGIAGMIIAIPALGIIKIVFEHMEPLKPWAYLMADKSEPNVIGQQFKAWFQQAKHKIRS